MSVSCSIFCLKLSGFTSHYDLFTQGEVNPLNFLFEIKRIYLALGKEVIMRWHHGFNLEPLSHGDSLVNVEIDPPTDRNKRDIRPIKFAYKFEVGVNGRVAKMIDFNVAEI